ncbi:MAG TPA: amidase family protein, partial [Candidatus Omnitrophota bacterium]|nr:amidase family protein [Candidatus Omnitrophota bacterium]
MPDLFNRTISELRQMIDKEGLNPADIIKELFDRITKIDGKLKAIVSADRSVALERLAKADKRGRLFGIPALIKDNICVEGENTTCASRILNGFKPPYDATVIRKLKASGAVLIGKANMDEFAFGSS